MDNRRSLALGVAGLFSAFLWSLETPSLALDPVINEFLASNQKTLTDENGDSSDWIEIYNPGPSDLPLNGWYLTDVPAALQKWRFPSVTMAAGGYLVVFASGKNRIDPASELHTNFKLDASGEYLALIKPDGLTVAQEFAPHYPPQREDISYGIGEEVVGAKLVGDGALAKFFVPADDALGLKWTGAPEDEPFDDSTQAGWTSATTGIGFDVSTEPIQPLAYWSFDDASNPGQALDSSGFANHGVITSHFALAGRGASSKPVYSPDGGGHTGRPGDRALDFGARGDGALVQVPSAALGAFDSATENDAITISAWLFGSSDQPADDVVFWGSSEADGIGIRSLNAHVPWSDATIYWDTSGCCDGTQRIFKAESDSTKWRGRWNHYVFVKDGDLKQIWQNGSLFHHGTNTADLTLIRGFFIGGSLNNGEWSYGGLIDDFAVWDRALTASQIQSLAGGASPLALSSLSPLVGTDSKSAMLGKSASVYLRIPFDFGGSRDFNSLLLRMKYNDGFVAYLNGVEVARRNAPAAVRFDSSSALPRAKGDAFTFEDIRLDAYLDHLQPGRNILAIHGLNGRADSPDFLIFPELVAARSSTGRFLSPPTPGAANVAGVLGFVANTQFGLERGFFKEPVDVEISNATEGAKIYYTTDGSDPASTNPQARLYSGALHLSKTTTLRARAFKEGFEPSDVDTQTYLFIADVARQPARPPGFPTTWSGGFPADYEVDPDVVKAALPGYGLEEALLSIASVSLTMNPSDLFGADGGIYYNSVQNWERQGSIEVLYPDGTKGLQANAGLRIHGYTSADHGFTPKHSFRVVFKSQFGPSKLKFPLFPSSPVERFDQVVLRGMSTDSWPVMDGWPSPIPGVPRWFREKSQYLREQWMKDSQLDMGQLSTHGTFVHLYLNGLYWGLYHLTERPTDEFLAEHLGGKKEEYDALKDFAEVQSGSGEAWGEMMALAAAGLGTNPAYQRLQGNNPDGTRNPSFPKYLDVDNLIDYMILHIYAGADDWPNHNWWAGRRRGPESQGFKFFVWDQEITNISLVQTHTSWGEKFEEVSAGNSPAFLYAQLRQNAEFRVRFGDRVHKHLFNGGALAPESSDSRWMLRAAEIDKAIVGESARWGDSKRAVPYKREVEWLAEQEWMRNVYWEENFPTALQRFKNVGLYPDVEAPLFNQHGGRIPPGFRLLMTAPAGSIRYTLDGSDPRRPGGSVSPAALTFTDAVFLQKTTPVKARVLQAGKWSALTEAVFFPDIPLRITEIMYHPALPPPGIPFAAEDFEFIELQNIGSEPLDLTGVTLSSAIQFDFSDGLVSSLPPGKMLVVVRNLEAFAVRYAVRAVLVAGEYRGELQNSSERIVLSGRGGESIHDFRYLDAWEPGTDGGGYSLVVRDVRANPAAWGDGASWRSSNSPGGSPGFDDDLALGGLQYPGDLNQDGARDLSDAVALLGLLFLGSTRPPPCEGLLTEGGNRALLDSNGDRTVDLSDAVYSLRYLFSGGPDHVLGSSCVPIAGCPKACGR